MKERIIRAVFDSTTITVYQAYNPTIASSAVHNQTFVSPPFKKDRMTWIKPSFLWMMYRSGWAAKTDQENILAVTLTRKYFEWSLHNSSLSHFDSAIHSSYEIWKSGMQDAPVRIQWDPEKDIYLQPLHYRSIQIGLSGIAVEKYMSDSIVKITDITDFCKHIHKLIKEGAIDEAQSLLPKETIYPLPQDIAALVQADY